MSRKLEMMRKNTDAGLYLLVAAAVFLVCAIYGQFLFGNRLFIFFKDIHRASG